MRKCLVYVYTALSVSASYSFEFLLSVSLLVRLSCQRLRLFATNNPFLLGHFAVTSRLLSEESEKGTRKNQRHFLSRSALWPPQGSQLLKVAMLRLLAKKFSSVFIVWRGMNTLVNTLVNTCKYMCICVHSFIIINMYFFVPIPHSRLPIRIPYSIFIFAILHIYFVLHTLYYRKLFWRFYSRA